MLPYFMPLSNDDCAVLVLEIIRLVREHDPGSLDLILHSVEQYGDSRKYLIELLRRISSFYAERSSGAYGKILDRINRYVRLENGSHVRGLSVELSPVEKELYRAEDVNLAELPDRSDFVTEIRHIIEEILRETNAP
ncbi:MAG: hypothetical protein WAN72_03575 [Candidatus Acidiferrales bacterium]